MATPLPEFTENARRAQDREFVRALRRNLSAVQLLGGLEREVPLGVTTIEWQEVGEASDAIISMDFDTPAADAMPPVTSEIEELPLFSKYRDYGRRYWDAVRRSGMDTTLEEEFGRALAEELNNYLYFGTGDANLPGPQTGILNDADSPAAVDNTGTKDWTNAEDVITDLAEAIRVMSDNGLDATDLTLLMSTQDSDIMFQFDSDVKWQVNERIPGAITQRFFDRDVNQGEAFLIKDSPDVMDVFVVEGVPLGQPAVDEWTEEGGAKLWKRWWQAAMPRLRVEEGVQQILFDRS